MCMAAVVVLPYSTYTPIPFSCLREHMSAKVVRAALDRLPELSQVALEELYLALGGSGTPTLPLYVNDNCCFVFDL